jgi:hypothetical protein
VPKPSTLEEIVRHAANENLEPTTTEMGSNPPALPQRRKLRRLNKNNVRERERQLPPKPTNLRRRRPDTPTTNPPPKRPKTRDKQATISTTLKNHEDRRNQMHTSRTKGSRLKISNDVPDHELAGLRNTSHVDAKRVPQTIIRPTCTPGHYDVKGRWTWRGTKPRGITFYRHSNIPVDPKDAPVDFRNVDNWDSEPTQRPDWAAGAGGSWTNYYSKCKQGWILQYVAGPSTIVPGERGLFAARPFKIGEKVAIYDGQTLDPSTTKEVEEFTATKDGGSTLKAGNILVDGNYSKTGAQFMNDAKGTLRIDGIRNNIRIKGRVMTASKSIQVGRELCFNYTRNYWNHFKDTEKKGGGGVEEKTQPGKETERKRQPTIRRDKVISVNANGLRSAMRKGLIGRINTELPDVILIQEAKTYGGIAKLERNAEFRRCLQDLRDSGYMISLNECTDENLKGHAGTLVATRKPAVEIRNKIGHERTDREGRVQTIIFANYILINAYLKQPGLYDEHLEQRADFIAAFDSSSNSWKPNFQTSRSS